MRQKLNRLKKPSEAWIYDQVFSAILDQRLMPDTKLTEKDLCGVFGVSRTIIRKVLLRLSIDRVVELRPNRGAVIAAPGPEEVREIFEARRLLEDGIVAEAAEKYGPEDAQALDSVAVGHWRWRWAQLQIPGFLGQQRQRRQSHLGRLHEDDHFPPDALPGPQQRVRRKSAVPARSRRAGRGWLAAAAGDHLPSCTQQGHV